MKINWFINLNQSTDINPNNLFDSSNLVISKNKIFVPSNDNFYILDFNSGNIVFKKNYSSTLNQ